MTWSQLGENRTSQVVVLLNRYRTAPPNFGDKSKKRNSTQINLEELNILDISKQYNKT